MKRDESLGDSLKIHKTEKKMRTIHKKTLVAGLKTACLGMVLAVASVSASDQIPAGPQKKPIVLVGGTIHTMAGATIENGMILFDKGKIVAVGEKSRFRLMHSASIFPESTCIRA